MNIWNKTFLSLLTSEEPSSVKLALLLLNNNDIIFHWWFLGETECSKYSLPELRMANKVLDELIYSGPLSTRNAPSDMESEKYIKRLYEKNNTVE